MTDTSAAESDATLEEDLFEQKAGSASDLETAEGMNADSQNDDVRHDRFLFRAPLRKRKRRFRFHPD